jgi:hypothetical protein
VLVALDLELALPQLTVDVEHLVDRQPVTVLEDPPVIRRQCVFHPTAQEHRARRRRLLPLDVAPAPGLGTADPQAVRRGRAPAHADDQRPVTASNRRPDLFNALNYIAAGVIFWCSVFRRWSMPGPEET